MSTDRDASRRPRQAQHPCTPSVGYAVHACLQPSRNEAAGGRRSPARAPGRAAQPIGVAVWDMEQCGRRSAGSAITAPAVFSCARPTTGK